MIRQHVSSRKIDGIRAVNQGLKQQEADAKILDAQANFARAEAEREVGLANARAANPLAFSKTPLLDKAMGIYQAPARGSTAAIGQDDLGMPSWGTSINSGGAAAPGGLTKLGVQRVGNTYSASPGAAPESGSYEPNPNVSYGGLKPVLGMPSFGGSDPAELMQAFADGGPVYGPPGEDMVPAEMPDGSPARLDDGEFVLPKDYVVAYAVKALGKKGASLPPEKLHALGIDLLTQDVTEMTGKAPGPKAMPPLPGQMDQQAPGMAAGAGLPWDPYAQNNWVSAPQRGLRLSRSTTPQDLAQRPLPAALARDTASNVARTNNTIGAARAVGAQAPEFMRALPPTNQMPVPYQGPPSTAIGPVRQGGAMVPYGSAPVSGANVAEDVIRVNRFGDAARGAEPFIGSNEAQANTARAARAARGSPIYSQAQTQARADAYARAGLGGRVGSAAKQAGSVAGRVAKGVGRGLAAMDPIAWGAIVPRDTSEVRSMLGLAPNFGPNNGPGVEFGGAGGDVPLPPGVAISTPSDNAPAAASSQVAKYGLNPALWSEGSGSPGYADRTKATLEADQRKRGEAYGRLTGLQPNAMNQNDAGYVAGLTEGFKNYQPGRNYADQIMRRGGSSTQAQATQAPQQPSYIQQAWQMTRDLAEPNGISPEVAARDIYPRVLEHMAPREQKPDAAMARLQWEIANAPNEQAKWAAEQQAAAEQATMQQAGNAYRNVIMVPQWDENTGQYANAPYFFGPTGLVPLLGGNMGNSGQAPIVDRGYTKK